MPFSLDLFVYLILVFMPIWTMAAHQGSPPITPSCDNGHFIATCGYPGLKFANNTIGMYCLNSEQDLYGYNWTSIDLNMCLTNDDGQLIPSSIGSYSDSCFNCTVSWNSTVYLTCDCWNMAGTSQSQAAVDLNSVIYNTDGAMGCCEQLGNKTWRAPPAH